MKEFEKFDRVIIGTMILLLVLGFLEVSSAMLNIPETLGTVREHCLFIALGLILFVAVVFIESKSWGEMSALLLMIVSLIFLVLMLFWADKVNGSRRWLKIWGIGFQPSEFFKLASIIFIAAISSKQSYIELFTKVMSEKNKNTTAYISLLLPLFIGLVCAVLSPDFDVILIIGLVFIGMWLYAKNNVGMLLVALVGMLLAFFVACIHSPYILSRLGFNAMSSLVDSGVVQPVYSLAAVHLGSFWGAGLGNSLAAPYVTSIHNDLIFALIGEEFGFAGMLLVVIAYAVLTWRIWNIANKSRTLDHIPSAGFNRILYRFGLGSKERKGKRLFQAYVAYGIGLWIFIQSSLHMISALSLGIFTGLTLPLISDGGSSMVITFIALGIVMRIDYENRLIERSRLHEVPYV